MTVRAHRLLLPVLLALALAWAGAAVPPAQAPAGPDICSSTAPDDPGNGSHAGPTCAACLLSLAALLPERSAVLRRVARRRRARPSPSAPPHRRRPVARRARAPPQPA